VPASGFAKASLSRSVMAGTAICGRDSCVPNFATAVELHHLVDAIKRASDTGREVYFEE